MGRLGGKGLQNAAGTGPAFGSGVGTPDSALNLPAGSFPQQQVPGMTIQSPASIFPAKSNVMSRVLGAARGGLNQSGPQLQQALSTRPATESGNFSAPQMSYVAPPNDPLANFYGG